MSLEFHLADLFETAAGCVPDRIAILGSNKSLTYADLDARTDRLAAGFWDQGLRRGDHIALYMMNAPAYLESFIAAIKIGTVPYNVNYRYQSEELQYLFRNADTACIIHGSEYSDIVEQLRDKISTLKITVSVGGTGGSQSIAYDDLLDTAPRKDFQRSEEDYLLLYTGGTTGMPKGVMWPHKAFIFACAGGAGFFHKDGPIKVPEDIKSRASESPPLKMFTLAPLMHGAAIWSAWTALLSGLTVVLDESKRFDPEHIWNRAEKDGANIIQVVGDAMAIPLRDSLRANPDRWNLGSVVSFGSGGAVFSDHVKEDIKSLLPNAAIMDGVGASETGISGQAMRSEDGMLRLPANEDQQVIIDDRFGKIGEIGFIGRSGHIPIGYYNDPVKSSETFKTVKGRIWAVSGDSARLDEDGMITVFGRGSTCINSGGEKIYPEEVEEALRAHPAVFDTIVIGKSDERWGQSVAAILALRPERAKPDNSKLVSFLKSHIADYKVPKTFIWVDAIRRSPAGKPDIKWAKDKAENAS